MSTACAATSRSRRARKGTRTSAVLVLVGAVLVLQLPLSAAAEDASASPPTSPADQAEFTLSNQANAQVSAKKFAPGNGLADSASPYLLMHAGDPVNWQPWGEAALEQARAQNKLLFVSVGYFSCHWCHVMHRDSFQNAQVAADLNADFVSVKVDRELNPALDTHLIEFVQATRGRAGWPLNVFLTPDGHPLLGTTYLPRDQFRGLLQRLAGRWGADAVQLRNVAAKAADMLAEHRASMVPLHLNDARRAALVDSYREQLMKVADHLRGGFGDQAKFPSVPQLLTLISLDAAGASDEREFLRFSLNQMQRLGLHDQVGGGFFRYVTDPDWQVPHFEKMLYDNAQLAELYTQAAQHFGGQLGAGFEAVARQTLDFMLREMLDPRGAFISSLSAVDEGGQEGQAYLIDTQVLAAQLSAPELQTARIAWGLNGVAPLHGGQLPLAVRPHQDVARTLGITPHAVRKHLASARAKLLALRAPVPRDGKLLAAWNGLALAALAKGAALSGGDAYARAGQRLRDYLVTQLWDGRRVLRMRTDNGEAGVAGFRDYVYLARGLLAWARVSGDEADFSLAEALTDEAWQRFRVEDGWRLSDRSLIPHGPAYLLLADGELPSPSALWAEVALALARRGRSASLAVRARQVMSVDTQELVESPFFHASHMRVLAAMASAKTPNRLK